MLQSFIQSFKLSPVRWHITLALLFVAVMAAELFVVQALTTTEYRLTDMFMRRHAPEQPADPAIVIIDIDDPSMSAMQEIAGLWSWPREIHADLLVALAEFTPRAIVFDIAFSERDLKRPKSDAQLSKAIVSLPQTYLAAARLATALDGTGTSLQELTQAFGITRPGLPQATAALQLPHVVKRTAWRLGLTNSIEDSDGVLRRYRLYTEAYGWQLPSLPARVMADLGATLPTGGDFLMRWPGSGHKRYAYSDLYRLLTEQRQALSRQELRTLQALFHDKIIVIGSSATGSFDHHLTPLGAGYPGVDILAVALDNLKNAQAVRVASPFWPFAWGMILIALLAWAFTRRVNPLTIAGSLAVLTLATLGAVNFSLARNLHLALATPLVFAWLWFLLATLAGYLRERRTREQAVSLFRRFLNPDVVRQIVDHGETIESLSGRTREITVLFSDIRGFTTLSETCPPHEVVHLLNRYFDRQVEVVFRHGGTLDKFIGDCIMAFWGAPLDEPAHASRAVAAAMEMQETLITFRKDLADEGSSIEFEVGIGVHSGSAVVGFIGAKRKLDYTAIGDTVNLASRVEGLTKGVARVLVTHATMLACQPSSTFSFQSHGAFVVKGRAATVDLYEPIRIST